MKQDIAPSPPVTGDMKIVVPQPSSRWNLKASGVVKCTRWAGTSGVPPPPGLGERCSEGCGSRCRVFKNLFLPPLRGRGVAMGGGRVGDEVNVNGGRGVSTTTSMPGDGVWGSTQVSSSSSSGQRGRFRESPSASPPPLLPCPFLIVLSPGSGPRTPSLTRKPAKGTRRLAQHEALRRPRARMMEGGRRW